jgi:DNA polymerase epsilon subunit 1
MTSNKRNKNYIQNDEMARYEFTENPVVKGKTDDHELAATLGFVKFDDGPDKLGWLLNMNATQKEDKESGHMVSVVGCYFMCQDGSMFKVEVGYAPYFYLLVTPGAELEMDGWLRRKFSDTIKDIEVVEKEDLDLKNHLSGLRRKMLRLTFWNVDQLVSVKQELLPHARRNARKSSGAASDYSYLLQQGQDTYTDTGKKSFKSITESILGLREHDVPFHIRFAIDMDVRAGHWFMVSASGGNIHLRRREDLLQRAEPRVCAFDIETTKLPLQFPNMEFDQIFMISYMIDKQGFLIINREVVSEDIDDFEYTPKPEFVGPFKVFNCANERECLRCWFDHMRDVKPGIYVTYNGDFFDWPFIETRAKKLGMDMEKEIGFKCGKNGECLSRSAVHMDCLHWVNRDSYLPQGSRGLKAVTKYKLGYDPVEVDPEDMVKFAAEQPQAMASYSVSDAVATYYLYMTYVHPFIFSLSTIIPMPPDEVLRKGSGTLCEMLLMVQAFKANIVAPNKHTGAPEKMHVDQAGISHLLNSETYIGGKVEALESGVFRADFPCKFRCSPEGYQQLIDSLDGDLAYSIEHEGGWSVDDVENYESIRDEIKAALENLRDNPIREENPLIYHLDVAAMYPNIILTNRLQPSAIVTDEDCAACVFNAPGKTCLRKMEWVWRGETYSATRAEYASIKAQLQSETFPVEGSPPGEKKSLKTWNDLSLDERNKLLKNRLKTYCQKVYKRVLNKPESQVKTAGICQRENGFYYDTVRDFRDRRYEYKGLNKKWKGKLEDARASGNAVKVAEAADMCVLYDSLQLAHKCILNSFYGYVMRKGARWYSMEMAGVVTHCGANIIKRANELITKLGRPLELDTDGIWCALPKSFPEDFKFVNKKTQKVFKMSYPCAMLNVMVANHNTNDQFETLVDKEARRYERSSEMTIEFEVDGPYLAMVLPASKEEGKLIKKRYAVFNFDGSLAELKGFELKRRGELKLIKVFQSEVFDQFLLGSDLKSCYDAVAAVANRWIDMLDTKGKDLTDQELIDHISESSVMSKGLDEYEGRKSCAITCARRLAEFLGDGRVRDKGLVCNYVLSAFPTGTPTSERAIPVAIFSTEPSVARTYLKKWCGGRISMDNSEMPDVRDIIDWAYYKERLGSAIQKIITIPAAMQQVSNPVPRIKHPDWLHKRVAEHNDAKKQASMTKFLTYRENQAANVSPMDIEDFGSHSPKIDVQTVEGNEPLNPCSPAEDEDTAQPGRDPVSPKTPVRAKGYSKWLESRKKAWRKARMERKRKRLASATNDHQRHRPGLKGMFDQHSESLTARAWNVVSLSKTRVPGVYKAWVVINGGLHSVNISVPRIFYVNSSLPEDDPLIAGLGGMLVSRVPTNCDSVYYVYQFMVTESLYIRQFIDIQARLVSSPKVFDVYEAQISPHWVLSVALGCVTSVVPTSRDKNVGSGLDISDVHMEAVQQEGYFRNGTELGHNLLYHSEDSSSGRALMALHMPSERRCHIWVINPVRRGQKELNPTVLAKSWDDTVAWSLSEMEEFIRGSQGDLNADAPKFEMLYCSKKNAAQDLRKILKTLRTRATAPTMLLLSSPNPASSVHLLPELSEMPHALMSSDEDQSYPSLGWQTFAIKDCFKQMLTCNKWLEMRLDAARYAQLPVGSFGNDWIIDTCDTLYFRMLKDAGILLWARDESEPDLSCRPTDIANRLVTAEHKERVQISWPGMYRNVCIQIRISHLAVSSILESATLGEIEGAMPLEDQRDGSGPAFKVLKGLATMWIEDASKRHNVCADTLLRHMYRWLCSENSRLYDPRLMTAVQELMKKLLLCLVAELKKLGANVVHADNSCIILATGKHAMKDALGYADYILDTLRRRELFQWMSLSPEKAWSTLMFLDKYNYLGLSAPLPTEVASSMSQAPGSLSSGSHLLDSEEIKSTVRASLDKPQFDYTLTVVDYLPAALSDAFVTAIAEFVWLPWKQATLADESTPVEGIADLTVKQDEWVSENLPGKFTEKLLKATKHISMHIATSDGHEDHQFPMRAGSYLSKADLGTPALAFVKSVCHMYALDRKQTEAVTTLRRQLLRMIHVKEFSPEAAWKDPCASLLITDVSCPDCLDTQDLDVCRDPFLQQECPCCNLCGAERDTDLLERKLIAALQSLVDSYLVQDTKCIKCGLSGTQHLRRGCDVCGGHMDATKGSKDIVQVLEVLDRVAHVQGMPVLECLVRSTLAR